MHPNGIAYAIYSLDALKQGRNAVAIFGKRESPQFRIFFAAAGAVDVSSSKHIGATWNGIKRVQGME